jgi:hypothetical protein
VAAPSFANTGSPGSIRIDIKTKTMLIANTIALEVARRSKNFPIELPSPSSSVYSVK